MASKTKFTKLIKNGWGCICRSVKVFVFSEVDQEIRHDGSSRSINRRANLSSFPVRGSLYPRTIGLYFVEALAMIEIHGPTDHPLCPT